MYAFHEASMLFQVPMPTHILQNAETIGTRYRISCQSNNYLSDILAMRGFGIPHHVFGFYSSVSHALANHSPPTLNEYMRIVENKIIQAIIQIHSTEQPCPFILAE